ncbi:sodium- and chloride-dependent GABA transporter ine isoform X1 [Drosophila miranda]|uniref:sodium- and chloride-dependent GABA transporter ine isoform X1 n=1 Tax=Drosophila miranda TaxID=7229 RepID=UPI0007E6F499|nr:sodium- and chloride-dependent GABA transporter ine isoform X1 [Drosophila miranda]XP_017152266.1 sodium- and chloride-dependent GABA transporter ine isoform X1 [Drosophila miranda]XP_017152267.1 sodium- and chloride-dependent GABA transporter ine isoform X1 [Drosophila miranda]XP_017152268.1 sodium- and chloride-dependent GABA transporter ine isoform X1 [Drosophila miranda]
MSDSNENSGGLAKTASSPTALNLVTKRSTLRHSQLSDSGAESCGDGGDEQARLIRSSSSRAHKYIIIPATPTPGATATVTFTLDDCDPAIPAPISPTPATLTCTTTTTMSGDTVAVSPLSMDLRRIGSHSSSMRSVVSGYMPALNDSSGNLVGGSAVATSGLHAPNPLYMQPQASLSGSSYLFHDLPAQQIYSDVTSVRSLASIGIGSTDGRKLVIRRVPTTANELFDMVNPQTPPPLGIDDDDSYMDMSDDAVQLKPRQQHWANKMQFVLACIGYSVGLGNVWRFPYMCYKSGGGVFLVPYCIILFICSIPLLFMELSVGQYTGRGPIGALGQLCPLFKGAGLASVVVSFLMSTYYSVIIGYSIYYFFTSFKTEMPWIDCNNRWNTPDCWVPQRKEINASAPDTSRTPSEEFFENKVLQISGGLEYPGMMRWELFACLICAWLMVYFATWKSIKSSAKVRYFTATFPFVLIIILMVRAVTLDGAAEGLRFFFRPKWSELKNANVWINAASQNFNSLGITFGSMISFASYNKYNNNILRDTIAVSAVNMITSLLVGIFAFSTLGNLALEQNTNVRDVIGDGPGMIFVVYPQAMAKMPYAQLWAVMFFFMLLCLGLNSQFAIVEVVVTSIQDGFPRWIKRHLGYHEIVVLFVCVISCLFGMPNIIQGGIYYFQLMDHYAASVTIMFLAFCQMIAIAWFYGTGRLSKNVKQMTGKAPSFYLRSCWLVLGPCLLFAIWVLSLINYREPTYHNGRYTYPDWAYGIGWMFASFSLICIPGYALINFLRTGGDSFWDRIKNTLRPNIYECKICGEHHCEHDYPEQEQYMLAQELATVYRPTTSHLHLGAKSGYNAMQASSTGPQGSHSEYKYQSKAHAEPPPNTIDEQNGK